MNVFTIKNNLCISFSGGRTSAYMLWKYLDYYNGRLPDNVQVCFANTGREMPQTLDFVRDCSEYWQVPITWLELGVCQLEGGHKRKKYEYETRIVDYESASRNGEPFMALIKARQYLPNPVARFCTADLKVRRINSYLKSIGWSDWDTAIGIRADEPRRAHKMLNAGSDSGEVKILPLWWAKVDKYEVFDFWKRQPFDLQLPNNNGVTDWGNCDLCFMKGEAKSVSIIREKPELADWWITAESEIGSTFRKDRPTYENMKIIATTQSRFDFDDITIPCFCGD